VREAEKAQRLSFPGRAPWIVILAAALVARLVFVLSAPNEWQWPDSREYEAMALSLYEHGSYGLHTLRAPGYPTLIAGVYSIFGPHLIALRLIEALLGVLTVGLIGAVGGRLFGRRAGLVAALLAALQPVMAFLPTIQYAENTLMLLVVAGFGAMFEGWRRGGAWRWAAGGALWGLALLTRPNTVFALPGVWIGLVVALRRQRKPWVVPALAFFAACALTVTPWIVRNHRVHGEWFFIATGGGRQVWIGNNPHAEADSRVSGFILDSLMVAETSELPNDIARERYFYRKGLEYMREHPGRSVLLYLRELRNLFALWPETKSRFYITVVSRTAQCIASVFLFAGVILALLRFRATPEQWVLIGAVVSFALGSAFFFTIMRYRMTVEPCLLWIAGAGWDIALSRWARTPVERAAAVASSP
jgi:4-amino-4-deoxy-L-arabinose transferase-like glycosyltransferase